MDDTIDFKQNNDISAAEVDRLNTRYHHFLDNIGEAFI
jgi:hypothetical protein